MRVQITVDPNAVSGASARIAGILEARRHAAFASIYQDGERIMATSNDLCPVETGALRASGHVTADEAAGLVTLEYGGPAAPYAFIQHEDLEYRHPVGQAKFLEQPFIEAAPEVHQHASDAVRAVR